MMVAKLKTNVRLLRIDPTRTTTIRRAFIRRLRKKFSLLRGKIISAIKKEDWLGLKQNYHPDQMRGSDGKYGPGVSIGIPREEMPQVKSEDLLDFISWMNSKGIPVQSSLLSARDLSPTQKHFKQHRVDALSAAALTQAVIISKDNYVIDGTHRWVRHWQKSPEMPVPILQVGLDIDEALKVIRSYPKVKFTTNRKWPENEYEMDIFNAETDRRMQEAVHSSTTVNAFCPTGEGGGIDPTCSPDGGGLPENRAWDSASADRVVKTLSGDTGEKLRVVGSVARKGKSAHDVDVMVDGKPDLEKLKSSLERIGFDYEGQSLLSPKEAKTSRKEFAKDQWSELHHFQHRESGHKLELWTLIGNPTANTRWAFANDGPVGNRLWAYYTDPQKLKAFTEWLKQEIGNFDGMDEKHLWEEYIKRGFTKGAGRAYDDYHKKQVTLFGDTNDKLDFYQGTRDQFLKSSFAQPESADKVRMLVSRAYEELDGMTVETGKKMARTLADGLVEGKHPKEIAKDLVDELDIAEGRAETIAQTELIRAHAEGQLYALEALGVTEIGVQVEWATAGDNAVCDECADMEGTIFEVDQAHNLIPAHPNCRCAFIPANVGEKEEATENRFKSNAFCVAKSNAFCATGSGGGVDPSCGKGSGTSTAGNLATRVGKIAAKIPAKTLSYIKQKAINKYKKLEKRYGKAYAAAIIGAAVTGLVVPAPGASIALSAPIVALAELHRFASRSIGALSHNNQDRLIRRAAKQLVRELKADFAHLIKNELIDLNAFCPTGPGGGVDPTCSPGASGGGGSGIPMAHETTLVKSLPGSTNPQLVKDATGKHWVMKSPGNYPDGSRLNNEGTADAAYRALGVLVPKSEVQQSEFGLRKMSEYHENSKTLAEWEQTAGMSEKQAMYKEIGKNFVADALMANWDVIGLAKDNILIAGDTGKAIRIDNGGALLYRAQGTAKGDKFGPKVGELESMRDSSINPSAAKVFGHLTDDQVVQQIKDILPKKETVLETVKDSKTKEILTQRFEYLKSWAEGKTAALEKAPSVAAPVAPVPPAPKTPPVGGHDLTTGTGVKNWLADKPDLPAHLLTNTNLAKIEHLNPQGLDGAKFYVPKLYYSGGKVNQEKMAQMTDWLKGHLPVGKEIAVKGVHKGQMQVKTGEGGTATFEKAETKSTKAKFLEGVTYGKTIALQPAPALGEEHMKLYGKLTTPESIAISSWKGSSASIRKSIASGSPNSEAKNFLSALSKQAPYEGTLYRGLSSTEHAAAFLETAEKTGVGGTWSEDCPMNMSRSPQIAAIKFGSGGLVMRVKAKTARPTEPVHNFTSEREVVGLPGVKYRIIGIHKNAELKLGGHGGHTVHRNLIDLEEL